MNRFAKYNLGFFVTSMLLSTLVNAQTCGTDSPVGVNILCNGDFENGDSCFTTNYIKHSTAPDVGCGTCYRDWSNPDEYEVVTNVTTQFHSGFPNISDVTPGSGNHFLAVDGSCTAGLKVWCQTVTVTPNTNYWFRANFTSLHSSNPALLQFEINGSNVGATFSPTTSVGTWSNYEFNWFSGAVSGSISICIENLTTAGCGNGNDFAIDDISFIPGCSYATSAGPQPDLGPDRSLCIEGSPITLDANVPQNSTTQVTWSTGATGLGLGAPYSINVSSPGTYSVCVTDNGSCLKSDIIIVTNSFSVNLGPDVVLCNPTTALLNAGHSTVPGVTYVWRKDGAVIPGETGTTYTVTQPGTYRAEVTIPGCGMQFDEVSITSDAPVPNHDDFCPPGAANLSVTGSGTYEWYTTASGGSSIASGPSYNPTPGATTTYYVKDVSTFSYTVGESSMVSGSGNNSHGADQAQVFDAYQTFNLDAVSVYADLYTVSAPFSIGVTLRDNTGALIWAHTINLFAPNPLLPNPTRIVVPVNRSVPAGTGLRLSAEGTSGLDLKFNQNGSVTLPYPYTVAGVMSITDLHPNYNWLPANSGYGYFYDWEISAGVDCERVPVTASVNCPSPVTLLDFKATVFGEDVLLQWATTKEVNSAHFIVERSSDGLWFYPIGKVETHGNSTKLEQYSYMDIDPSGATNYYRLVQFDLDGSSYNSHVVAVSFEEDAGPIISPNPATDQLKVSLSEKSGETVTLRIYDTLGKLIKESHPQFEEGVYSETMFVSELANGVYFVNVSTGLKNYTLKFIKE